MQCRLCRVAVNIVSTNSQTLSRCEYIYCDFSAGTLTPFTQERLIVNGQYIGRVRIVPPKDIRILPQLDWQKYFSFVKTCMSCMYHIIHLFCFMCHVDINFFTYYRIAFSSNSQCQEKPVHSLCQSSLEVKFGLWLVRLNSVFVQLLRKLKAFLRQLGIAVQESWLKFVCYLRYSNLCQFSS